MTRASCLCALVIRRRLSMFQPDVITSSERNMSEEKSMQMATEGLNLRYRKTKAINMSTIVGRISKIAVSRTLVSASPCSIAFIISAESLPEWNSIAKLMTWLKAVLVSCRYENCSTGIFESASIRPTPESSCNRLRIR
ncbi:hypothetical protein ACKS0A_00010 [Histoplasma ohiense]